VTNRELPFVPLVFVVYYYSWTCPYVYEWQTLSASPFDTKELSDALGENGLDARSAPAIRGNIETPQRGFIMKYQDEFANQSSFHAQQ